MIQILTEFNQEVPNTGWCIKPNEVDANEWALFNNAQWVCYCNNVNPEPKFNPLNATAPKEFVELMIALMKAARINPTVDDTTIRTCARSVYKEPKATPLAPKHTHDPNCNWINDVSCQCGFGGRESYHKQNHHHRSLSRKYNGLF